MIQRATTLTAAALLILAVVVSCASRAAVPETSRSEPLPTATSSSDHNLASTSPPSISPTPAPEPSPTSLPPRAAATSTSVSDPKDLFGGENTQLWRTIGKDLGRGWLENVVLLPDGASVQLARHSNGSYVPKGSIVSEEHVTTFPFNNVVLSWSADAPRDTLLRFEVRARVDDAWTSWYIMGEWSHQGGSSVRGQSDGWGRVNVDTLELTKPANALQYRVTFITNNQSVTPSLRSVSVVYADLSRPLTGKVDRPQANWARDLPVPPHSQMLEDRSIAGLICSPTSLTMVLEYWGIKKPVAEVAAAVRDRSEGIYGNWPLNTAYAAAQGLDAYVDRFFSIEQLEREIASGRPVVISIRFNPGELEGSPIRSTDGHLIVVRGFTIDGDAIVNDPAAPDLSSVRRIYKRAQLAEVWLRHGGIVYVIKPQSG